MSEPVIYGDYEEHLVRDGETLASVAEKHGLTWQQLARFNFQTDKPEEINVALREVVGCTQRTKDGKNYIFSDSDVPGILLIPKDRKPLPLKTGKPYRVQVKAAELHSRLDLHSVDELGHSLGKVELLLRSTEGHPDVKVTTNKKGYGSVNKLRAGEYKVLLADGSAALLFDPGEDKSKDDDSLKEAVLHTRHNRDAIARIVIPKTAKKEELEQRALQQKIYEQTPTENKLGGQGQETAGPSRRSQRFCADNLALAAGWRNNFKEVDLPRLSKDVLKGYLEDYHPSALGRGYFVLALIPSERNLVFINSEGEVEGQFAVREDANLRALIGAYALFENVKGTLFVDMASMSHHIGLQDQQGIFDIEAIVEVPDMLRSRIDEHGNEMRVIYYTPTAKQLAFFALEGGTGRLEDYSTNEDRNESIHDRNLAVCETVQTAYRSYIHGYIERVKATANEDALRKLGPPKSPCEMPAPIGANDTQLAEVFHAVHSNAEFDAWLAIAHQLDRFANRLSQGYPFFRFKPKFTASHATINKISKFLRPGVVQLSEKSPVQAEFEFELQCDLQLVDGEFEVVTKGDVLIKGKVKLDETVKKVTGSGVPVEISAKQSLGNPDKRTLTVKLGPFTIESDTVGKNKLAVQRGAVNLEAEVNSTTGMFGTGITIKGKDLAQKMKGKGAFFDRWAPYVETIEVQFQLGFVGTREETVLAVVSNAPGFFERRSIKELFDPKTQWVDLSLAEHRALVVLGWCGRTWDGKYNKPFDGQLPASVDKDRDALSDEEKVAIVHLGFFAYEDYKKQFKNSAHEFADYSY